MKLWQGNNDEQDPMIERFTVGDDHILDQRLVRYDCLASKAHAKMLHSIGLLAQNELDKLIAGLEAIARLDEKGKFIIGVQDEDCHTAIENHLTKELGDLGKKIHTGRSRNDQVLTAIRLYEKDALKDLSFLLGEYRKALKHVISEYGDIELPGYTHMQKAMPTTCAMWLDSFVELSQADESLINVVFDIIDASPLGTAAGFGVPQLKLDRELTKRLMGFSRLIENPMAAQAGRGKIEALVLSLCTQIMLSLNKLASDLVLFNMSEFGFIKLSRAVCTGSSIMPQKKNPDTLELIRAKYHVVLGEEMKVKSLIGNLISGYNRDLQLTKGPLFCGIDTTACCLKAMQTVLSGLELNKEACKNALTEELFATKSAYELVLKGTPFREAYRIVAKKYKTRTEEGE